MAKQDFEQFKQEIKNWLDNHLDEYDAFVEDINSKSYQSIQQVYSLAMRLAPKLMKKARSEFHGDITPQEKDFETFVADDNTASLLVDEFHNVESSSIVPCLLSWLYYGKCYETMVERLEAEIADPKCGKAERWIYKVMIKFVIKGSIRNKMRTKEDWTLFKADKEAMRNGNVADNVIEEVKSTIPLVEKADMATPKASFEDYLLCSNKEEVIERIKAILAFRHTAPDMSYLYAALQELGFLDRCNATTFHKLLQELVPTIDLKGTRNFQIAFRKIFDEAGDLLLPTNLERKYIDDFKKKLQSTDNSAQ